MSTIIQPYDSAVILTKSDATVIPVTRALYVGGAGNLNVRMFNGDTLLFSAVPVGTVLPIAIDQLLSTNTTATLVIGLY